MEPAQSCGEGCSADGRKNPLNRRSKPPETTWANAVSAQDDFRRRTRSPAMTHPPRRTDARTNTRIRRSCQRCNEPSRISTDAPAYPRPCRCRVAGGEETPAGGREFVSWYSIGNRNSAIPSLRPPRHHRVDAGGPARWRRRRIQRTAFSVVGAQRSFGKSRRLITRGSV